MTGRRIVYWAVPVATCWLVTLLLALLPVTADYGSVPIIDPITCGRPVTEAFHRDPLCTARSQARLGTLAVWLVLTGAVSTAFVARCALAGARRPA